ncbi:hypothetical protein L7F22_044272 [Adiantum nelumboides]|nr:hypothetical protein [Adiantum nelumboides]
MQQIHTTTNAVKGHPESVKNKTLESIASVGQSFEPTKRICAHLNAFHAYANDPKRFIETNHYCSHLNEDVRQCILYDSPEPNARLIGIEYMIKPHLYKNLDEEERKLWHSHIYEVKSGMLIMPKPDIIPDSIWEIGENKEMEEVIILYGKVFHLWQTDRGDKLPLGIPQLMTSFTKEEQLPSHILQERDQRFHVSSEEKKDKRSYIVEPEIHDDADSAWRR